MTLNESLTGEEPFSAEDFADSFYNRLLNSYLAEQTSIAKYNTDCKAAIMQSVSEFLPCFIILGYDYNGDAIEIVRGKTDQEKEALGMRFQKFASVFLNSQMGKARETD